MDMPAKIPLNTAGGGASMPPDMSTTASAAESSVRSQFEAGGININKGISTTTILAIGGIAIIVVGMLLFFKKK